MAQPTTGSGVGFLDLPPEIRNMIYDLALVSDGPIRITERYTDIRNHFKGTYLHRECEDKTAAPSTSLLRARKRIYGETVQVLCEQNTFQLRDVHSLTHLLTVTGNTRQRFRHLRLALICRGEHAAFFRSALVPLKTMTQLESFELMGLVAGTIEFDWTESYREALLPLLRAIEKRRKTEGGKRDVFDVIKIGASPESEGSLRAMRSGRLVCSGRRQRVRL